jgi:hypothetical protein
MLGATLAALLDAIIPGTAFTALADGIPLVIISFILLSINAIRVWYCAKSSVYVLYKSNSLADSGLEADLAFIVFIKFRNLINCWLASVRIWAKRGGVLGVTGPLISAMYLSIWAIVAGDAEDANPSAVHRAALG